MKANGATSLWEMWEKDLPGHSLLHSSYLYPGAWYIEGVGGIHPDTGHPGFRRFTVRPPLLRQSQIAWAKTSFDSPVGVISTYWERNAGRLTLKVTVPPNCSALVYFPSRHPAEIKISSVRAKNAGKKDHYSLYTLPAGKYELSGKEDPVVD
jgi:alpha-L-rhamnosidase